jgi:hypothetical protein
MLNRLMASSIRRHARGSSPENSMPSTSPKVGAIALSDQRGDARSVVEGRRPQGDLVHDGRG